MMIFQHVHVFFMDYGPPKSCSPPPWNLVHPFFIDPLHFRIQMVQIIIGSTPIWGLSGVIYDLVSGISRKKRIFSLKGH